MTCGGFLQFDWPNNLTRKKIGDNKHPKRDALNLLFEAANNCVNQVIDTKLIKKLNKYSDYLTLGVDSKKTKVATTHKHIGQLHAELVVLLDLKKEKYYWSGKSYPTNNQEKGLVRIEDLGTHFIDLKIGKTMILGCHDLAIFNPRSKNATGWRKQVNEQFKRTAQQEKPKLVLHHPHTTVKKMTWWNSWQYLQRTLPCIESYAGAGCYFESDREKSKWDTLEKILLTTKKGHTIDFIWR